MRVLYHALIDASLRALPEELDYWGTCCNTRSARCVAVYSENIGLLQYEWLNLMLQLLPGKSPG